MPTDELSQLLALGAKLLTRSRTRIVVRVGNMFSILWPTYRGWRDRVLIPALLRRLYPKADAIIAVSQGVAHDLQAFFCLPAEKVTVIFNPKELAYIARRALEPVAHPWLADQTLPVVVAVSRLRAQKDLPTLLRAFAEARRECPSRLLILGKGSDADALEHLARELGIADAVAFLGYVENPHAYTARADIFVSTSRWEGMPNSVVEAIACGVPVVATDCDSGPREILAPDTDPLLRRREGVEWAAYGVLAPVGGVREVAEALTTLLRAPDRRAAYAAAARHRAAAFDACRIVDRYLACMVPQDESGGTGRP
jgi:glycosyltransferase involved in cell wall biosynthesis